MKRLLTLALALAILACFAACGNVTDTDGAQSGDEEGVLRIAFPADITTMDLAKTTSDYFIPMNIYDRLFEIQVQSDGSTEIVNSLVSNYSVSDDGLTYSFTLRDDVTFSNGDPLMASDVEFTFKRLLTYPGSVNPDIPLEIKGAQALYDGQTDTLEGFVVTGDYTFEITLDTPNAGFIAELTGVQMSIMDAKAVESASNFGIDPAETIGSGPYIVTDWKVNESITLVKNENYWQNIDNGVNKVILYIVPDASTQSLMYQNGQLDILDMDYLDSSIVENTYKTQYADNIVTAHRVGLTYFALNEDNSYLSDVNVRKAIQMSIDRQGIIDEIYGGNAILENGIIPTGVWGHDDDLAAIQYDPAGAKALLTESGYADGEISFEISLDNSSSGNTQLVIQKIQQDLAAVGITANIGSYDESSWLDLRKSGKMDSFVATWTMDYNDPANIMYTFFGSPDKTLLRSLNYPDADVMARVAAANSIMDDNARMTEYQDLEKIIVSEDAAWVPLLENSHLFAVSDRVASFTPQWAGYTDFYVRDVTLK